MYVKTLERFTNFETCIEHFCDSFWLVGNFGMGKLAILIHASFCFSSLS